jgi:hypothetical protein
MVSEAQIRNKWATPRDARISAQDRPKQLTRNQKIARRLLVAEARELVRRAAMYPTMDFGESLEQSSAYLQLRPYLSQYFRTNVERRGRILVGPSPGSIVPGLAAQFADEVERIEGEWGLRD